MKRLPRRRAFAVAIVLAMGAVTVVAEAHDLFLRPRDFVVRAGSTVNVRVLNGTFTSSEGAVSRDRLRDLSVVGPAGATHPSDSSWSSAETESAWRVGVGEAGTYVLGASLAPRTIRLTGAQFNDYLREEGLARVVAARRRQGIASHGAHERYAKHVKALVRVRGERETASAGDTAFRHVLGYPAELVPLDDPYRLAAGSTMRVRALLDGKPLAGHPLLAGGRTPSGAPIAERTLHTGADGVARVRLAQRGAWYIKFVHMRKVPAAAGDSVDYESKWATLTFARP